MRKIFNFLLTIVIFWLGNKYFSESVSIADTKTLLIVSVGMFALGWIYSFAMLFAVGTFALSKEIGCLFIAILIVVAIIWTPIRLLILESLVPGFHINGFWTYVLLTIIFSIFLIGDKNKNKNNQN